MNMNDVFPGSFKNPTLLSKRYITPTLEIGCETAATGTMVQLLSTTRRAIRRATLRATRRAARRATRRPAPLSLRRATPAARRSCPNV